MNTIVRESRPEPTQECEPSRASTKYGVSKHLIRRVFLTVLAVLIPFVVFEITARIVVSLDPPLSFGFAASDETVRTATQSRTLPGHKCVLILGDSLASNGIDAELLSGLLSRDGKEVDVVNLATGASRSKDQVFYGQLALDNGLRPDLVICDVWPQMFSPETCENIGLTKYSDAFASSIDGRYIASPPRNIQEKTDQEFCKWSYFWKYRSHLKAFLQSLAGRIFAPLLVSKRFMSTSSDAGWHPVAFTFHSDAEWNEAIKKCDAPLAKSFERETGEAVLAPLKNFCATKNLPLLFISLPKAEETLRQADRHITNHCAKDSMELLSGLADRKGIQFMDLGTDEHSEHYWDGVHLNAAGSVEATYRLAKAIRSARLDSFVPPH